MRKSALVSLLYIMGIIGYCMISNAGSIDIDPTLTELSDISTVIISFL